MICAERKIFVNECALIYNSNSGCGYFVTVVALGPIAGRMPFSGTQCGGRRQHDIEQVEDEASDEGQSQNGTYLGQCLVPGK